MVFTGQGAQWPKMDTVLHALPGGPEWFIVEELMKEDNQSNINRALYAQSIFNPHAVIGHSSGELAAAYAAGRISASQAIVSAYYRGLVSQNITHPGAMAAVNMSSPEVQEFLVPGVVVACDNSPSSVTLSGDMNELETVVHLISSKSPETVVRKLKVDVAYHSHHMREVGDRYRSLLEPHFMESSTVTPTPIAFYSSLTGSKSCNSNSLDNQYWQDNLESPVRFREAFEALVEDTDDQLLFLSVGPHPALWGPIRQIMERNKQKASYVSCLHRGTDCAETFLSAIRHLFCQGVDIDFNTLTNSDGDAVMLKDLPTYPWEHSYSKLYMPRENKEWRWCKFQKHELLGIRVIESTDKEPSWRNVLHLEYVPWLRDHTVMRAVVFPAAGYISIVEAAFRQISPSMTGVSVRNMVLSSAMVLNDAKSTEIITSLRKNHEDDWYSFTVSSHDGITWTEHCYGSALWIETGISEKNYIPQALPRQIGPQRWYKALAKAGLEYGPAFRGVSKFSASTTQRQALATIITTVGDHANYFIYPTRLDSFFQTVIVVLYKGQEWNLTSPYIPIRIGQIDIRSCISDLTSNTWVTDSRSSLVTANRQVFDETGALVVRLEDTVLQTLSASTSTSTQATGQESESTARLHWKPNMHFRSLAELVTHSEEWAEYSGCLHDLTSACIELARSRLAEHKVASKIPHL
ncbi:hypothetical protein NLG97_g2730 [Lecanicillium saksenae]|uniref:Uncharacterized protein n=1 Tax=Lecanicillium saksenae TaxID=468837 RepID=A0ACC1R0A8_9HYPO|nr:hypothetical protein NLG97_g2730 [Lecanicillium saksenae]